MSTTLKSTTARANGAKSRGPATPAGRAKSSRNSLRHGLASPPEGPPPASPVLATESREHFQLLLDSYLAHFAPAPGVEAELVAALAATRWRLRRLQTIETTLLGNEIVRRAEYIEDEFSEMNQEPSNDDRLAYTFKKLADNSQSLTLLIRYEGVLQRSYDRAFKQLHLLQSARRHAGSPPQPNEPKPAATSLIPAPFEPSRLTPLHVLPVRDPAILRESDGPPAASCDNRSSPVNNVNHLHS